MELLKGELSTFAEASLLNAITKIYAMIPECGKAMEDVVEEFNENVKGKTMGMSKGAIFLSIYYRVNPMNKKEKFPQEIAWKKVNFVGKSTSGKNVIYSLRIKGRLKWSAMKNAQLIRNKEVLKDFDVRVAKLNDLMKRLNKSLSKIRESIIFFERNQVWTFEELDKNIEDPKRMAKTRRTKAELEIQKELDEEQKYIDKLEEKQAREIAKQFQIEEDPNDMDEDDRRMVEEYERKNAIRFSLEDDDDD